MWSDEMDKKIKEAAENDLHSYEEKFWPTMEALLDKHLPQEKKRRRFIFFILLFLGLGAASIFLITQTSTSNKPVSEQKIESAPVNATVSSKEKVSTAGNDNVLPDKTTSSHDKISSGQTDNNNTDNDRREELNNDEKPLTPVKVSDNHIKSAPVVSKKIAPVKKERNQPAVKPSENIFEQTGVSSQKENSKKEKDKRNDEKNIPVSPVTDISPAGKNDALSTISSDANAKNVETEKNTQQQYQTDATTANEKIIDADKKQDDNSEPTVTSHPDKKEKTKKQKGNKLIISLSAGPDLSFVGSEPGTTKMQYGMGIGYAISDRFTVRAGFYAGRKIYTADSNSYHTPFTTGPYYSKLDRVDANCLIYEIPIIVVYSFAKTKNHNWFVSTGLSSYLMKEEDYLCTYKNPAGQQQTHNYSYTNNSHLFSVLNFSGGYQYHFTDRFSFMAEPYLKLPLTGIGFGKVNLNSAGVLFTLGYKPFLKAK